MKEQKVSSLETVRTEGDLFPGIDAVIIDMDLTLITAREKNVYYSQYYSAVNRAVSKYIGVGLEEAIEVANFYRREFNGGESAIISGTIGEFFPQYGNHDPDVTLIYEEFSQIDPHGHFDLHEDERQFVQTLRRQGKKVVLLTDCVDVLAKKVLAEAGFEESDFDATFAYTRDKGPLKIVQGVGIFLEIADLLKISPNNILSMGDSLRTDIQTAEKAGMKTCLVTKQPPEGYSGLIAPSIIDASAAYKKANERL